MSDNNERMMSLLSNGPTEPKAELEPEASENIESDVPEDVEPLEADDGTETDDVDGEPDGSQDNDGNQAGHNFDKGLQKLQQKFSEYQKQSESRIEKLTELVEKLASGGQDQPDELDVEYDDDDPTGLMKQQAKLIEQLREQIEEQSQTVSKVKEDFETRQKWEKFHSEHPQVGDGRKLWESATDAVLAEEDFDLEDPVDAKVAQKLVNKEFYRLVKEAEAKSKKKKKASPPPTEKVTGSKPSSNAPEDTSNPTKKTKRMFDLLRFGPQDS